MNFTGELASFMLLLLLLRLLLVALVVGAPNVNPAPFELMAIVALAPKLNVALGTSASADVFADVRLPAAAAAADVPNPPVAASELDDVLILLLLLLFFRCRSSSSVVSRWKCFM